MHPKSFDIFIKYRVSKFFFTDTFYFLGTAQSFGNDVGPLSEFLLVKINVSITKGKKKHVKYYLHIDIS